MTAETMRTEGRYFEPAIETMERGELRALQLERLLATLERTIASAPLYQQLWASVGLGALDIDSLADFSARAPLIDKETLREYRAANSDPYSGLLCVPESELTRVGFGSGTTGDPIYFAERYETRPYISQFTARDMWEMGLRPGEFFTWFGSTFRSPWFTCAHAVGAAPLFCDHHPDYLPEMVRMSQEFRPTVGMSISSPLLVRLVAMADSFDLVDAFSSYKGMLFAGEALSPHKRETLASFGLDNMFEMSAAGDMLSVFDCQEHAGFHVWEDAVLVEVLDPETQEPVPAGEVGEMVITALVNEVAPFIRYRSDDLIRWTTETCGCGRTHGRFTILGRASDQVLVQGRSIMPADIMRVLEPVPATSAGLFQVLRPQREVNQLALRVGYDTSRATRENVLESELTHLLGEAFGVPVEVSLIDQEILLKQGPPHKIPRVVKK